MLSTLFDSTRSAAIVGTLLFFGSVFLSLFYDTINQFYDKNNVLYGSIVPMLYIFFQSQAISVFEQNTVGINFNNITENVNGYSSFDVISGGLLGIGIFILLTIYFEIALPKDYGTNYGFLFFLNPYFYCDLNSKTQVINNEEIDIFETEIYEKLNDNYKLIESKGD